MKWNTTIQKMIFAYFILQLMPYQLFFYHKMQKQKPASKQTTTNYDAFTLYKNDLEDLFLSTNKLPKSLLSDFTKWSEQRSFRGFLHSNIFGWFNDVQSRIVESAKKAHQIIDNLLVEKIPTVVIELYIQLMLHNKKDLSKQLNSKEAQGLFKYVPTQLIVEYLQLFEIKLTEKEKNDLIDEFINSEKKNITGKVVRLPAVFKEKTKYAEIIIQRLMKGHKSQISALIIKKYKLPLKDYQDVQISLIQNSARAMPHWEKQKFCWERLQQVYQLYPSAIAQCIKGLHRGGKKISNELQNGFASIINRIPQVRKYLPHELKSRYNQIKTILPNRLKNNEFKPSDIKKYFSLSEFQIGQKDVIWVDESNIQKAVFQLFESNIIGIDTQSTVARTTLSNSLDLLSIVQISNGKQIYIFDAKYLKKNPFKSQIVNSFFRNQKNTVVGHTLDADLNEDVVHLFDYRQKVNCQKVDICPIFKKHFPGKRAGLAFISQEILGKQICKEYTLTNWDRRPLNRNQIHYAALDAFVVLKIWDILKEIQAKNKQVKKVEVQSNL